MSSGAWFRTALVLAVALAGAGASAQEAATTVEKCAKSFGTLAVAEPQSGWGHLQQYGLGSPAVLLRTLVQRSGCFDVVERGAAMQNLQQERAMMNSGDLRADSNVGQGQMQAADFVLTPTVQIGAQTTGGVGAGLLGRFGVLGALAAGLKFKEASTSLLIADVRSSLQVAAAEGKATKTDFTLAGFGGGVGAGGFTNSAEGKVVAASFLDNYNRIVLSIRDQAQLIKPSSAAGDANAAQSTRAEAPMKPGQMLAAKIANVRVYAEPSRESAVVGTLQRNDDLVATGDVKNGFVMVDTANFSGWVQRTLVGPSAGGAAPAPAAPAPVAVPAARQPVASYRYGNFAGSLDGADKGSFRVLVDDRGRVTGEGSLQRIGVFGLMGQYDAKEDALMMHGSSGAGGLLFVGRLDAGRGVITGSWTIGGATGVAGGVAPGAGAGGGGTFSAQRQ